jgi:DNA-binding transcriptional LysR family regulator
MTLNFRQIRAFVAVYEEGSFNRAARRENATQSGLSMQIGNLEAEIGLRVFERSAKGVVPTQAGERLYRRATAILRAMSDTESELAALAGEVSGRIRVGLIPAFTYSLLAPALAAFIERYRNVDATITEAYSPTLSEAVARGEFDFAVVPAGRERSGIRSSHFGSDRELLVSGRHSSLTHLEPVRLAAMPPLKLVLPTHGNARRERLETYFAANGVGIAAILEMDAMLATLEFVAETEWMTIVPSIIVSGDVPGKARKLNPIVVPRAGVDYTVIEPSGRALSVSARLFLETLRSQFEVLRARLDAALPEA